MAVKVDTTVLNYVERVLAQTRAMFPDNPDANNLVKTDPAEWIRQQTGLVLDDWQRSLCEDLPPRLLLNCPRQSGKSTATACMASVKMLLRPTFVLAIAPSYRQSKLLHEKVLEIIPPGELSRLTVDTIELNNGSKFVAAPGDKPSTIRGMSPQVLLMDEFSRVKSETIVAVLPSVAAQGDRTTVVCLSTPAGQGNEFHRYWTDTDPSWRKVFVSPEECSRYTSDVLELMKTKLTPRQYQQEFLGEFLEGAGQLFSAESIAALVARSDSSKWTGKIGESSNKWEKLF